MLRDAIDAAAAAAAAAAALPAYTLRHAVLIRCRAYAALAAAAGIYHAARSVR